MKISGTNDKSMKICKNDLDVIFQICVAAPPKIPQNTFQRGTELIDQFFAKKAKIRTHTR